MAGEEIGIDARLDSAMAILEKDPELQDEQDTEGNAPDPATLGNIEPPKKEAIGEDQEKTNEPGKNEPKTDEVKAIEPPVSWPSDDKEAFKALPTWAQERIVARENEREAHFAERSRTTATRERELQDIQARTAQAQTHYAAELDRLNQLANQLMPAKFSDIKNEADYLKLKVENPARASEYEAFVHVLRNAHQQKAQAEQARVTEHLNREYSLLSQKFPEFQDAEKAKTLLNEVRKACTEWYGFSPQEVEIIADHRHVPIIRDAMAWRQYQANIKAAQGKKVPSQLPTATLRTNGQSSSSVGADQKAKILNRARQMNDTRAKADLIASLL